MNFNKDFIFGVATSSYQIEGARHEGGRTDSIWDRFSRMDGKIIDKSNGDIACDHYHKYKEDIQLMKELGVDSYRFSISWSRIIPEKGEINRQGIEFYRNLIHELHNNNITASVTIYHWDLPQWIYEENKGWVDRDTVDYFKEYSEVLFKELGDLVDMWITLNEPFCSAALGYLWGVHAPGHTNFNDFMKAHHHLLLAHGEAVKAYRQTRLKKPIGITLNTTHTYTPKDNYNNNIAMKADDGFRNRLFYDPLFKGHYPDDMMMLLAKEVKDFSFIQKGDLDVISIELDFMGLNYYNRNFVEFDGANPLLHKGADSDLKRTEMDWEVTPWALYDTVKRLREDYTTIPVYITENGSAWNDQVIDGQVNDEDRVEYLNLHLDEVKKLNEDGMNIAGYYAWSLMDNFEWAYGYTKRFGIIYVDYESQARIPKESYYRYQEIIKNRTV